MPSHDVNTSNLRHLMEYYARKFTLVEHRLKVVLPEWIALAHSIRLKAALRSYLKKKKKQVKILELFFTEENIMYDSSQPSRSMQDFVLETNWRLSHAHTDQERDAWLLASVCAVNQFKINMYEMGIGFARSLGMDHAAQTFEDAGIYEKQLFDKLGKLAVKEINLALVEPVHITG